MKMKAETLNLDSLFLKIHDFRILYDHTTAVLVKSYVIKIKIKTHHYNDTKKSLWKKNLYIKTMLLIPKFQSAWRIIMETAHL